MSTWLTWNHIPGIPFVSRLGLVTREKCMRFRKQKRNTSHLYALKLDVEPNTAAGLTLLAQGSTSSCQLLWSNCVGRSGMNRSAYPVSHSHEGSKKQARSQFVLALPISQPLPISSSLLDYWPCWIRPKSISRGSGLM